MAVDESLLTSKYLEPAIWVLMLWLARELWSNHAKRNQERDTETEKNTAAILTLDKSIIELKGQISLLLEQIRPLQRLPEDVAKAHEKLRKLEKSP
jgi:hypothetical protein